MDDRDFQSIRKLVYEQSGINLTDAKRTLVVARLIKRQRALGLDSVRAYLDHLAKDTTGAELVQMIDAISTNVTHFFREKEHFDLLRKVADQWWQNGRKRIRIWCAAASTGEEPYTLAITMQEWMQQRQRDLDLRILATDISTRVLQACLTGRYDSAKLEPVPALMRDRYFTRRQHGDEVVYEVNDRTRQFLKFARLNLASPPFPMKGPMDAVFCRNVMIYFDNPTRQRLLSEILRLLAPAGYLFVGHAESLSGSLVEGLRRVGASVYQKAA